MNKRKMATAAGILTLIGGSLQLICGLLTVLTPFVVTGNLLSGLLYSAYMAPYIFAGAPLVITGSIIIPLGISALKNSNFGYSLIGSLLSFSPFIYSSLYLNEYSKKIDIFISTIHIQTILLTAILLTVILVSITVYSRHIYSDTKSETLKNS